MLLLFTVVLFRWVLRDLIERWGLYGNVGAGVDISMEGLLSYLSYFLVVALEKGSLYLLSLV